MSKKDVAKTIGLYDMSKNNVAKAIGFTHFSKQKQLLKDSTVDTSKNNVADTNCFSNIVCVNVVRPLVLTTVFSNML